MSSRLAEVSVDCADPEALAAFWCAALDYRLHDADDELVTIGPAAPSDAPLLVFARVPEPKTVKNRLHLDLRPRDGGQDAEVRRLVALGARHADVGQGEADWVVLLDPEGNELCVLAALAD